MYSFKEKKKHLEELSNKDASAADLLLLKQAHPTHHSLHTFERNPKRYAQDILYALLDYRSRDEIRMHRREIMNKEKQEDIQATVKETPEIVKESVGIKVDVPASVEEMTETTKEPAEIKKAASVPAEETVSKTELEEVKDQLQEAEERAELVEEEKESLQEELENEQKAREQAEKDLVEEKKKEPKKPAEKKAASPKPKAPPKSKSTKNTRK